MFVHLSLNILLQDDALKIGEEDVEPSEASNETVDIPGPDAATPVENGDAAEAVSKGASNESSDFESLIEHYLEASKGWIDSSVKFSYLNSYLSRIFKNNGVEI